MSSRTIWLVPNVTFSCDKKCSFCLVPEDRCGIINSKFIEVLVNKYKNHISQWGFSRHNALAVLGGEPLLEKELVKELIIKVREITPALNCHIFTNGLRLDEEFMKWAKEFSTTIMLSINDSPISLMEDRMKLISEYKNFSVFSVVLTKENMERIDQILDIARQFNFHLRLRHLYEGAADPEYLKMYDEVLPRTMERILTEDFFFWPHFLYEMTAPFWFKSYFDHCCGKSYYVIDPDGSVRTCLAQNNLTGNIFDKDFEFVKSMDKHKHPRFWLLPDKNDECKICQFKTLCGGGCPLTKIIAYGNVNEKSPFCPTFKKVFPVLLKIRSKWITQKNQTKFQELVRKDFPKDTTVSNIG